MLQSLGKVIVSFLELLEAQGLVLKEQAWRLGLALAILIPVMALACLGLVFSLVGFYFTIQQWLGFTHAQAALLSGLLSMTLAGGLLWLSRQILK